MDTSLPPPEDLPAARWHGQPTELATEIRHSAYLIGGALGFIGAFAMLLLFLTTRFGG